MEYGFRSTPSTRSGLLPGDGGDPYPPLCVGVLVLGYELDHTSASLGDWGIVLHNIHTQDSKTTIFNRFSNCVS